MSQITVFLSVGEPHTRQQELFVRAVQRAMHKRDIELTTLGRNSWSVSSPLSPVRDLMRTVHGAVILAMERMHINEAVLREGSEREARLTDERAPTTWTHIEAAMAYQVDLPLLILKEAALRADGVIDPAIHEWMVVPVDTRDPASITRAPLTGYIDAWVDLVRARFYRGDS